MKLTLPLRVAKELKSEIARSKNATLSDLKTKLLTLTQDAERPSTEYETEIPLKSHNKTRDFFASNTNDAHTHKNESSSSFRTFHESKGSARQFPEHRSKAKYNRKRTKGNKPHSKFAPISWEQGFTSSGDVPKAKTSYQAKSEFDAMIKDWISTNWLNADKLSIQKKPCHFLIHDRLAFNGLSVFNAVLLNFKRQFPDLRFSGKNLRQRWYDEFCTMSICGHREDTEVIRKMLRELVKTVFMPSFKLCNKNPGILDSYITKADFELAINDTLHHSIRANKRMINYLKNFENLNPNNSFTYIKDRELSLLPALDYQSLVHNSRENTGVFNKFSVLQYDYIFGNKVNDFKNLKKVEDIMDSIPSEKNPYFIIMTGDKQTSLEYYRLLKLMRQTNDDASSFTKKGCVVYLNERPGSETSSFFPPDKKKKVDYGSQLYNIIDHFGEVYDVLEAL
ncbi:DEBR0S6_00188g1_1 [Brettanomyces bruxellensis]|uniref:DEBR0S6_00188g1_1 n=1 Tax=Dekkera bruxellensis TaxID=5007 RepID=A0A7D9H485_DEKBR|nr:DEBR0S6_00188g1_1 [Brettanomyces bruxellensis]